MINYTGTAEGEGLVGLNPYTTFTAGIYFLGLQMARTCKINSETLMLTFFCIDQIFQPYHFKMVSAVL